MSYNEYLSIIKPAPMTVSINNWSPTVLTPTRSTPPSFTYHKMHQILTYYLFTSPTGHRDQQIYSVHDITDTATSQKIINTYTKWLQK